MLIIDTETGGLNPTYHALCSIGMVHGNSALHLLIQPPSHLLIDSEASAIHGYNRQHLYEKGIPEAAAADQITAWLTEHDILDTEWAGMNPAFDRGFLAALFDRCGKKFPLSRRPIDIQTIAWLADRLGVISLPRKNNLPSLAMDSILTSLGRSRPAATHNALTDCELTEFSLRRLLTSLYITHRSHHQ